MREQAAKPQVCRGWIDAASHGRVKVARTGSRMAVRCERNILRLARICPFCGRRLYRSGVRADGLTRAGRDHLRAARAARPPAA